MDWPRLSLSVRVVRLAARFTFDTGILKANVWQEMREAQNERGT